MSASLSDIAFAEFWPVRPRARSLSLWRPLRSQAAHPAMYVPQSGQPFLCWTRHGSCGDRMKPRLHVFSLRRAGQIIMRNIPSPIFAPGRVSQLSHRLKPPDMRFNIGEPGRGVVSLVKCNIYSRHLARRCQKAFYRTMARNSPAWLCCSNGVRIQVSNGIILR